MSFTAEAALRAVHVAAFGVEPELSQIQQLVDEVEADPSALNVIAARMQRFVEHLGKAARHAQPDHSQNGEFRILLKGLVREASSHAIVVDVGANGREGSNAFDLLKDFGWKGLLIEANPDLAPRIRREFGPVDYELVTCAIGITPGAAHLHLGVNDQISSLFRDKTAWWGEVGGAVEVEVRRLSDVLIEKSIPLDFDLLSLDIEGIDAPVLNDLISTSQFRPRWIIIEDPIPLTDVDLEKSGLSPEVRSIYELVDHTLPNLILKRR